MLIGDIGGTNVRFALADAGDAARAVRVYACADFEGPAEAVAAYLAETGAARPAEAAFAIAAPITDDAVRMTNHPWAFSIAGLKRALGLDRLAVVNDFAAVARGLATLGASTLRQIGGGAADADGVRAVLGPGTGLGMASLVPGPQGTAGGWTVVASEGGHATLAAANAREDAVIACLRRRFGHVSAERAVSGPGLANLHAALAELLGAPAASAAPEAIVADALAGRSAIASEALALFAGFLGGVAGDLALTVGARGGVYIAGGIVPALGEAFDALPFRARFEAKGRYRDYLAAIPTFVITHPYPAFPGLVALLGER